MTHKWDIGDNAAWMKKTQTKQQKRTDVIPEAKRRKSLNILTITKTESPSLAIKFPIMKIVSERSVWKRVLVWQCKGRQEMVAEESEDCCDWLLLL